MKTLIHALLILALLPVLALAQPITMTTAQKVKLTVTPTPVDTIPVGTLLVWAVEGSTPTNVLGTFVDIPKEFAVWYLPSKGGAQVIKVSFTVDGTTTPMGASLPITVTYLPPTAVAIVAAPPVPR